MHILVAEDDDTTAMLIGRMLKTAGHVFERTSDGLEALRFALERGPYDAILTDWMMPKLDGLGLIRELRRQLVPTPPVIVLTAVASDEARSLVLEAGADDYLAKPVRKDELTHCIGQAVARGKQQPLAQTELAPDEAVVHRDCPIILMTAGTGGPVALQKVIAAMAGGEHAATVIVQHGPNWMLETFAHKLQTKTPLKVQMAENGGLISAGSIYVAPGGAHTLINPASGTFKIEEGAEVNFVQPSGDVLQRSALPIARQCVTVVLTGMGCDGAAGAEALRAKGAVAIVQEPSTADVSAMPKSAIEVGIGPRVVGLTKLAACIGDAISELKMRGNRPGP